METDLVISVVRKVITTENVFGFQTDLKREKVGSFCLKLLSESGNALLQQQQLQQGQKKQQQLPQQQPHQHQSLQQPQQQQQYQPQQQQEQD